MSGIKIAIVQQPPVHLDLKASIHKASGIIEEASDADLIVFGETWLTGYPAWLDAGKDLNHWNGNPLKNSYKALLENSPSLQDHCIQEIKNLARQFSVHIFMGLHERHESKRSLYNSIIGISNDGELVFHHRKMVPTFTEKLIHKPADRFDLSIHEVKKFRIGALICWEHWMPLVRQYYHDQNEEIHLALWPSVHENHQIASRHYAFEGRCYVVSVGQIMDSQMTPSDIVLNSANDETRLLNGGSCVIGPDGTYLLEPQFDKDEIIYIEIPDKSAIFSESLTMDVAGHYGRKDLFNFGLKQFNE